MGTRGRLPDNGLVPVKPQTGTASSASATRKFGEDFGPDFEKDDAPAAKRSRIENDLLPAKSEESDGSDDKQASKKVMKKLAKAKKKLEKARKKAEKAKKKLQKAKRGDFSSDS